MKPTFGRVSKFGVHPLCWSMDHVGPMTRTVRDNAMLLNVLAGYDTNDLNSVKQDAEDFCQLLHQGIKGSKIGIPSSFYFDDVDEEVSEAVWKAIDVFRSLGAESVNINIPHMKDISHAHRVTLGSEAYATNEQMFAGHAGEIGEEVKERFRAGREHKAYTYAQAQRTKQQAIHDFLQLF